MSSVRRLSGRQWVLVAALATFGVTAAAPLSAQARLSTAIDTTLITVGDRITMSVAVQHPAGSVVEWPDSITLAPFEALDAAAGPPSQAEGGLRSTATIAMTAFELGELEIPSFDVVVRAADGTTETLRTDRFGVEVVSVGRDESGDIREIRGPLWIPVGVVQIGLWLLVLLLVVAIAIWWFRRRGRTQDGEGPLVVGPPPRPAHEVALEALSELEASPMLERGQVKEYHIEVSDILRTYVEGHFRVHALEMTTGEVLAGLESVGLDDAVRPDVKKFLDQCDMVKFAKVRPSAEASRAVLTLGRSIVENTMTWRAPEPAPEPTPEPEAGSEAEQLIDVTASPAADSIAAPEPPAAEGADSEAGGAPDPTPDLASDDAVGAPDDALDATPDDASDATPDAISDEPPRGGRTEAEGPY